MLTPHSTSRALPADNKQVLFSIQEYAAVAEFMRGIKVNGHPYSYGDLLEKTLFKV